MSRSRGARSRAPAGPSDRVADERAGADRLTLTMSNVVPASAATDEIAAGAYAAMSAELHRAG